MSRRHYALIVLAIAALGPIAAAQPPSILPQAGVLTLRNGRVLTGDITRAGDFYVISQGEGSEIRLSVNEVELFCRSLLEAYEFKATHVTTFSAKSHLDLAKWAMRHGLHEQCAEQLATAAKLEPGNSQVKELESQLKLLQESPPPPVPSAQPAVPASR